MPDPLEETRKRFIESLGQSTQSLGMGRVLGQVYAHVYLSPQPQTLDDLTHALAISKGSASMSVRQLENWGALKRVWVKGDRKDYYEATVEFGQVIRKALRDVVGRSVEASESLLRDAEALLSTPAPDERSPEGAEWRFVRHRVRLLGLFRGRVEKLWNNTIVRLLMKEASE